MTRVVVLVSGNGRNLQSLLDHAAAGTLGARIAGVVSNRAEAYALRRAAAAGVPTRVVPHQDYAERSRFDAALQEVVDSFSPDLVALAGFMRVLGEAFVDHYEGRLLNIHPSLLPRHRGLHTHRRVLEAGDTEHGATVHFVSSELDGGPAIIQGKFIVPPEHTETMLGEKLMNEVEVKIYPQAVAWYARGAVRLDRSRVLFEGRPLSAPLGLDDLEAAFR